MTADIHVLRPEKPLDPKKQFRQKTKSNLVFLISSAGLMTILFYLIDPASDHIFTGTSSKSEIKVCQPGQGPLRFDPELSAVIRKVVKSVKNSRVDDLVFWASCDLEILQANSHQQVTKTPQMIMQALMIELQTDQWAFSDEPTPAAPIAATANDYNLPSKTGNFQLLFRKNPEKGWSWAGVATTQELSFRRWIDASADNLDKNTDKNADKNADR